MEQQDNNNCIKCNSNNTYMDDLGDEDCPKMCLICEDCNTIMRRF